MSKAKKTRPTASNNNNWRAVMASLDIEKIEVVSEQELGGDELYFTIGGVQVGPTPSLSTGESYTFPYDPIEFSGMVTVDLYEEDWFASDYVDSAYISDAPATGILEWMDGAGGMYDVYFNVLA
jgi:hypothetical protein